MWLHVAAGGEGQAWLCVPMHSCAGSLLPEPSREALVVGHLGWLDCTTRKGVVRFSLARGLTNSALGLDTTAVHLHLLSVIACFPSLVKVQTLQRSYYI